MPDPAPGSPMSAPEPTPDDPRRDTRFVRLYDTLREIAAAYLRREHVGHTLTATAVVHEAWLRLRDADGLSSEDRGRVLATVSTAIRRLLVDHARRKGSKRRGGDWSRVTLDARLVSADAPDLDLLALDEAMEALATRAPDAARVVELRVFCGLSLEETAEALDVTRRVVDGDWAFARAWLKRELQRGG